MLEEMFGLQDKLNVKTCGANWKSGTTDEGRVINWERYIVMEAAELLESFPYKHWKDINAKPDIANAKVEIVDIYHFIMSFMLESHSLNNCVSLAETCLLKDNAIIRDADILVLIEHIMQSSLCNDRSDKDKLTAFFNVLARMDMGIFELYSMYLVKNALNIFRQNHGYKDGSYVKVIDGKEDNETFFIMAEELAKDGKLTYDNLYTWYEEFYNSKTK